jgi:hypothetical protein
MSTTSYPDAPARVLTAICGLAGVTALIVAFAMSPGPLPTTTGDGVQARLRPEPNANGRTDDECADANDVEAVRTGVLRGRPHTAYPGCGMLRRKFEKVSPRSASSCGLRAAVLGATISMSQKRGPVSTRS